MIKNALTSLMSTTRLLLTTSPEFRNPRIDPQPPQLMPSSLKDLKMKALRISLFA
jgi:hypothetical protein